MPSLTAPQQGMDFVLHEALKDEKHERYDCFGVGSLNKWRIQWVSKKAESQLS